MAEKIWHCLPRHRLSHLVEYFPLLFIFCRFFKIGLFYVYLYAVDTYVYAYFYVLGIHILGVALCMYVDTIN